MHIAAARAVDRELSYTFGSNSDGGRTIPPSCWRSSGWGPGPNVSRCWFSSRGDVGVQAATLAAATLGPSGGARVQGTMLAAATLGTCGVARVQGVAFAVVVSTTF